MRSQAFHRSPTPALPHRVYREFPQAREAYRLPKTGRRTGLKIPGWATTVPVRFRLSALIQGLI